MEYGADPNLETPSGRLPLRDALISTLHSFSETNSGGAIKKTLQRERFKQITQDFDKTTADG